MGRIQIKRIYDEPLKSDGFRVLVDRVWPRGVSKERAALDQWMTAIAPSTELRRWFAHDAKRWDEFRARYRKELDGHAAELSTLRAHARKGTLTLLFGARDRIHNQAAALKEILSKR